MHAKGVAALVVALALVAAGCGGSSTMTKAEFAKRAEAVCSKARTESVTLLKAAVAQKEAQHLSEAKAAALVHPRMVAIGEHQLAQLEALKPPGQLQTAFVQWRQMLHTEINTPLRQGFPSAAEHTKLMAIAKKREALKSQLGLKEC